MVCKGSQVTALLLKKTRWTQKHWIFLKTFEFRHFIKTRVCEIDIPPWKLKVLINRQGIWVRNCLCRNWQATWETLHQLTKCETKDAKLDLFWWDGWYINYLLLKILRYIQKKSSCSLMVVDESLKRKKNDLEVAFWVHRCGLIIMHLRSVVVWRCNKTCLRGAPHLTSVSTLLIPTLFSFSENIPKKLEQFHFVYLPAFLWIPFPCFHCVGSKQNTG